MGKVREVNSVNMNQECRNCRYCYLNGGRCKARSGGIPCLVFTRKYDGQSKALYSEPMHKPNSLDFERRITKMRYSDIYKQEIRGNDCCPFWRPDDGGVCAGWPYKDYPPCPANEDGSNCPIFNDNPNKD